jgi:hypothetical protein
MIGSEDMNESTSPDGVGGERMGATVLRGLALMSLRERREVIPVTVMVVRGIDTLIGTGVVSVAEADRESIEGGELSVL